MYFLESARGPTFEGAPVTFVNIVDPGTNKESACVVIAPITVYTLAQYLARVLMRTKLSDIILFETDFECLASTSLGNMLEHKHTVQPDPANIHPLTLSRTNNPRLHADII